MQQDDDIRIGVQGALQALFDIAAIVKVGFVAVDFDAELFADFDGTILGAIVIEDDGVHDVPGDISYGFLERFLGVITRHGDRDSFVLDHEKAGLGRWDVSFRAGVLERRTMASSCQKRKVCIAVNRRTGQDGWDRL